MMPQTGAEQRFPPDTWLFGALMALVTVAYLTVSPLLLALIGLNYEESGGNILEKVHPATLLAIGTLGLAALANRNPLANGASALLRRPRLIAFIVMTIAAMAHAAIVAGQPFTPLIDTFIGPVLVFFVFSDLSARRARNLGYLIHALIAINALIGICEFVLGFRLTPFAVGGVEVLDDWRSSALLGHPLANASLTGAYLLALACGAGRALPLLIVAALFLISSAGMIVFGGRAATVFLIGMLLFIAAINIWRSFAQARFNTQTFVIVLIAIPIAVLALIVLSEAGVFEQFLSRFIDDKGSAETRIEMFELFRFVTWSDLVLGPDPAQIATLKRMHGLEFGIESFWVSFIMTYGLMLSIAFFAALYLFCREVIEVSAQGAATIFIFFFLVGSTSVSLSAKTPLFAALTLIVLVLLNPALQSARSSAGLQSSRRRAHAFAG